ncbi:invasion associated locus B family protein [Halocynthiibacter namhaensis]|uniref:invasion associated locus B family protein n=1 Tax=Halocynthiibacter namhaensis TaxID=1290553 RepID=UPI0005799E7F|nr:invasion associated locus B family protein [Halocynthiibacter namhaensis]
MKTLLTQCTAAAFLAVFNTQAIAQEATTEQPSPQTTATEADAYPTGTPQAQEVYSREKTGDWDLRCVRAATIEEEPCQLNVTLLNPEGNPVAELTMFRLPEGSQAVAGALIAVPLETHLPDGVKFSVDGSNPLGYQYTWCDAQGCFARVGFTQDIINRFKNGADAVVTIVPAIAPDQKLNLPMSLTGFTAAYNAMPVPSQ